jgi:hypothetical protein
MQQRVLDRLQWVHRQMLLHTLGLGPEVWRVLAKCHEIRNLGECEGDLNADDQIVSDLIAACSAIATKLDALPTAQPSLVLLIFGKAQNKFQDPAKLRRLVVHLIGAENWSAMSVDVKGDAYTSACWRRTRRPRRAAPGSIYPTPFDSGDRRSVSVE